MIGAALPMKDKTRAERIEDLPELVSRKELMEFLGLLSPRTLRNLIAIGKFPKQIRFNKRLHRWRRKDIVDWYEANRSWRAPSEAETDPPADAQFN